MDERRLRGLLCPTMLLNSMALEKALHFLPYHAVRSFSVQAWSDHKEPFAILLSELEVSFPYLSVERDVFPLKPVHLVICRELPFKGLINVAIQKNGKVRPHALGDEPVECFNDAEVYGASVPLIGIGCVNKPIAKHNLTFGQCRRNHLFHVLSPDRHEDEQFSKWENTHLFAKKHIPQGLSEP